MTRRRVGAGSVGLALLIVLAVVAGGQGAGEACSFDGVLPFEGLRLDAAQAAGVTLSEADALERHAELFPDIGVKDARLVTVTSSVVAAANGRLAWVVLRTQPAGAAHDVDGNVVKTVHICGISVLDAQTGELIFYADQSTE